MVSSFSWYMISKYEQTQFVAQSETFLVCGPIVFKARNNLEAKEKILIATTLLFFEMSAINCMHYCGESRGERLSVLPFPHIFLWGNFSGVANHFIV